jgi:2-polyprenyl-6-methoxyphenol hydroxylase-like FAD-dependent oxidoreductase
MRVAIAGGGIGGLTAALTLHRARVDVTVFEAVQEPRPLGLGINVLPHAVQHLAELGLLEELVKISVPTAELCYANRHGQLVWREPRGIAAGHPAPQLSIHRGYFQLVLLDVARRRLPNGTIRTGSEIAGFEQHGDAIDVTVVEHPALIRYHDTFDVLVGADGIHSLIRRILYPEEAQPKWSGEILWRAASRARGFLTGRSMAMIGSRRRKVVAYPMSVPDEDGLALINWIAVLDRSENPPLSVQDWNQPGKLEDFIAEFETWSFPWLDVTALFRGADAIYEFPMVDRDPLPHWTFGSVTLLGDAAHPMYPVGSNGASQAILDARALADALLREPSASAALLRYERQRLPATAGIVVANRGHGAARMLDLAEERAPDGFASVSDVFAPGELEEIAAGYRSISGLTEIGTRAAAFR